MNIFDRIKKASKEVSKEQENVVEEVKDVKEVETAETVVETAEEDKQAETVDVEKFHKFKVKFNGKKYKVIAKTKEEAEEKISKFYEKELPKPAEELMEQDKQIIIKLTDIFNDVADEIARIVTVAHPENSENTYERWIAVLTEELGEIVHELNDAYEGKNPTKNTYVECVQLASATILLANKFAKEHPGMFEGEVI